MQPHRNRFADMALSPRQVAVLLHRVDLVYRTRTKHKRFSMKLTSATILWESRPIHHMIAFVDSLLCILLCFMIGKPVPYRRELLRLRIDRRAVEGAPGLWWFDLDAIQFYNIVNGYKKIKWKTFPPQASLRQIVSEIKLNHNGKKRMLNPLSKCLEKLWIKCTAQKFRQLFGSQTLFCTVNILIFDDEKIRFKLYSDMYVKCVIFKWSPCFILSTTYTNISK